MRVYASAEMTLTDTNDGISVTGIDRYYMASSSSSGITVGSQGWKPDPQETNPVSRYHWSYEVVNYSDGAKIPSKPAVIGVYGKEGIDAVTVSLSSEAHTFSGTESRAIASSITIDISAFKGNQRISTSIGAVTGGISGQLTHSELGRGTTNNKLVINATSALDKGDGTLSIPIVADGRTFNKVFSWSVAFKGIPGKNGTDGTTTYTWIRYADTPTSGMDNSPLGKKYIGLAFNKTTQTESSNYNDYQWSLMPQNIDIGGRNLVLNSSALEASGLGSTSGTRAEYQTINTGESYMDLEDGEIITISFDIEMKVAKANPTLQVYNSNRPGPVGIPNVSVGNQLQGDVGETINKRISFTTHAVIRNSPSYSYNTLEFYSTYGSDNFFKISKLKVERGNVATDWTPAPEDTQSEIDNTKEQVKKTVKTITEEYYQSTSATSQTGGSWTETAPTWKEGRFIFIRSKITYVDDTTDYTPIVNITGAKGDTGEQGPDGPEGPRGIPGDKGDDGQSQWVHIRYSANSNGSSMTTSPSSTTKYVGIAVTNSATAPTYTGFTWSKYVGENGVQGPQGVPGKNGANGTTTYTWVRYADTPTSEMSNFPEGKKYIGLAFNKITQTESNNSSDYQWSLMPQNIDIGGRNLIRGSSIGSSSASVDTSRYVSEGIVSITNSVVYGGARITAKLLLPNTEYVMRYRYRKTSGTLVSFGGHTDKSWSNNRTYVDGKYTGAHADTSSSFVADDDAEHEVVVYISTPSTITDSDLIYIQPNRGDATPVSVDIYDWKLEKGNTATDWTPAPEDVTASIKTAQDKANAASQEAIAAQADATVGKNMADNLSNDSVITQVEKLELKREWDSIVKEKPSITIQATDYALQGSTEATNYNTAYTTLNNLIPSLLANMNVTSGVARAIFNNNFANYYDKRQLLLNRIAKKAKELADVAQSSVDNLEIGGRNLLLGTSNKSKTHTFSSWGDFVSDSRNRSIPVKEGEAYTFRVWLSNKISSSANVGVMARLMVAENEVIGRKEFHDISIQPGSEGFSEITFTVPKGFFFLHPFSIRAGSGSGNYEIDYQYEKLEKGNKATDWTPAPEDTLMEVNKRTYNPVRYIRDWQNGSTANTSNHWYEIQAYDTSGENIALGKAVTATGTPTRLNVITDGTTADTYAGTGVGKNYVQVDLGAVYYDITEVKVWHYHNDGRTYKETKTEVSADGINWMPIFDSYVEGEWSATSTGNSFSNTIARTESILQSKLAKVKSEAYADGKVTAEEEARIADADAKLAAAKQYAEDQILADKTIKDTRNDNQTPAWYYTNHPRRTIKEFKLTSTIGVVSSEGTYGILETEIPWKDATGGPVKQTFRVNSKTFKRSGTTTSWSSWVSYDDIAERAKSDAATAKGVADGAASSASAANSLLVDIASDSKLTATEKKAAKKEWDIIVGEKPKIDSSANTYGIITEKTAYNTAYNTLKNYLSGLLANLNTTSNIVGTTFRANFKAYYNARQDLLNKIADGAKLLVDEIEIGGRNLVLNSKGKLYRTFGSGTLSEVAGATRLIWANTSQAAMGEKLSVPLVVGETYTLSFEARGTITSPHLEAYILATSGANLDITSSLGDRIVTQEFRKYTATFKFTGNPSDRLYIGGRGPANTWLEVRDATVKLEKGNKATDWSPAPEDIQSQIDGVGLADKTEILSGTKILTNKADDSVVHVEVDGKTSSKENIADLNRLGSHEPYNTSWKYNSSDNTITSTRVHESINYFSMNGGGIRIGDGDLYSLSGYMTVNGRPVRLSDWGSRRASTYNSGADSKKFYVDDITGYFELEEVFSRGNWIFHNIMNFKKDDVIVIRDFSIHPLEPSPQVPTKIESLNNFEIVSARGKDNIVSNSDFSNRYSGWTSNGTTNIYYDEKIGKNYLDTQAQPGSTTGVYGRISPYSNTKYTISFLGKAPNGATNVNIGPDNRRTPIRISENEWKRYSTEYVFRDSDSRTLTIYGRDINVTDIKVERGEETPWNSRLDDVPKDTMLGDVQRITLSLSEPIRAVGGVRDRVYKGSDGIWKVERNVGAHIIRNVNTKNSTSTSDYLYTYQTVPNFSYRTDNLIASHVPTVGPAPTGTTVGIQGNNSYSVIYLNIGSSTLVDNTVSGMNNWLSNNPITIQYELAEPTIEILPQPTQDKLNNLRSFQDSNYVYTVINDKTDTISENLKPTLHATFKGGGWYERWKTEKKLDNHQDQLDKTVDTEQLNTAVADLDADKLSIESYEQFLASYDGERNSIERSIESVAEDIGKALARTETIETTLGDGAQDWIFTNTKIRMSDEGITLGEEASGTYLQISSDKISFFAGATDEVAYVSGGMLYINKAVFVQSIQVSEYLLSKELDGHLTFRFVGEG